MNRLYTILIIDDDEIDRLSYKRALKDKNQETQLFEILETNMGFAGVDMACQHEPDAILLDFHLPDCTAKEIIEKINSISKISKTPILVMTGHGSEKTAMTALKLGAKDYLIKDQLKPQQLKEALIKQIEISHAEKLEEYKVKQIEHQAHHDFLTGLANRIHLEHEMQRLVAASARHHRKIGVIFLDLDKFKPINDTYGHATGDSLLIQVSNRLKDLVRAEDVVARIGGDEFVLILPDIQKRSDMVEKAQVLITVLSAPYPIDEKFLEIDVSLGIAVYPDDDAICHKTLMHQADLAMYEAKSIAGSNYHIYGEKKLISNQEMLSNVFAYAFHNDELLLDLKPCVQMDSQAIVSVEPVIRWVHPQYQNISNKKIFHYAKKLGMLEPLWEWFLEHSFRNLQPGVSCILDCDKEMLESLETSTQLEDKLKKYQLAPSQIVLRLEELLIAHGDVDILKWLHGLHQKSYQIHLKNFGVAGLPLSVLTTLPLDGLGVSPLFVHEMMSKDKTMHLVQSIVHLCENFGLRVVAEGIYNQEQVDLLIQMGCLLGQGSKFDPMTIEHSSNQQAMGD